MLAISLGFTVGGYYMLDGDPRLSRQFAGWLCCGFFGLGTIVSVANLIHGASYLKIDSDGFTLCAMWRKHSYRWEDISHFGVTSVQAGPTAKTMIGYSFIENSPRRPKSKGLRSMNVSLSGYESALPEDFGRGYEALAAELTDRLTAHRMRS